MAIEDLAREMGQMSGYIHQIQIDVAEIKTKSNGESNLFDQRLRAMELNFAQQLAAQKTSTEQREATMSQRVSTIEEWKDSANKVMIGLVIGIMTSVGAGLLLLLVKGGLKL